jgi:dihydroorotase
MSGPRTLIRGATLIDPAAEKTSRGDVLIEARARHNAEDPGGTILDIGANLGAVADAEEIDAGGLHLAPGLIDMRVTIGEPGAEHKETLKSAGRAALAGGVTTMVVTPQTDPVIDDVSLVDFIIRRGFVRSPVRVHACAAATKGLGGEAMSELGLLREAGAAMFANGDNVILDSRVMRRVLSYSTAFGALIAHRPQDPCLAAKGVMHEGEYAARLGLAGIPAAAETIIAERDLTLAQLTKGRLLLDMISSAETLGPLARARARGASAFASVNIHNLTLNELEVGAYRTFAKLNPPLRTEADRQALIDAVGDGLIDVIVSGHDPRPAEEKRLPFDEASFGAAALETLLPAALALFHDERLSLPQLFRAMTLRPAELLGLPQGRLTKGAPADLVLFDAGSPFKFEADQLQSKAKNSPFDGRLFQGKVKMVWVGGARAVAA